VRAALAKTREHPIGIVQPDAHTDLLQRRLGVDYCFATWSLARQPGHRRNKRLVQVGIRASGKPKGALGVALAMCRQFWRPRSAPTPGARVDENVIAHVKSTGVQGVYFSNDIDEAPTRRSPTRPGTPRGRTGSTRSVVLELSRHGWAARSGSLGRRT